MTKITQHIITISVLTCFLFYTCATVIMFNYRLDKIKSANEVRKEVSETDHVLTRLVIPLHEVQWEHEFEFFWDGFMYDVVEKETINDTLYCIAYKDIEETTLKKELARHYEKNQSQHNNKTIDKFQFPTFIVSANSILIHPKNNILLQQYYSLQMGRIFFAELFIPPDQC